MAVAVAEAGGLGSLPCAGLSDDKVRDGVAAIRSRTSKPLNLNFFCHDEPERDVAREAAWLERLAPYYQELGVEMPKPPLQATIYRFTDATCAVVEDVRPEVVSFHFGLPEPALVQRVKRAGCKIICSATTRREALWLAERGVDAIIAQGAEAGGHRGMFLETDVATQIGTFALVQQIVRDVKVPVIAAGGISDGHSIAAAFALGAAGVQIGTAYLRCPEATTSALHQAALAEPGRVTVIADMLSGRPARGIMTSGHQRAGADQPGAPSLSVRHARAGAAAQGGGSEGFGRFFLVLVGAGRRAASGDRRRRPHAQARR